MPLPTRQPSAAHSGVLRRTGRAGPRVPLQPPLADQPGRQEREYLPSSGRAARLRAAWEELQHAWHTGPEAPVPSVRPRRRSVRAIFAQVVLAMLLGLLLLQVVPHQTTHSAHSTSPGAGARQPTTGTGLSASPGRTAQPSATTSGSPPTSAEVAASFLAAYFSWTTAETDNVYSGRWLPLVAPEARRDLLMAAPRLTLDHGADSAAQSPKPGVASAAFPEGTGHVIWTIQVLPPGGEQVTWQSRLIQATLTISPSTTGPLVASITWTSTEGGNG